MFRKIFSVFLVLTCHAALHAATPDSLKFYEMTMEQLMNVEVAVASKNSMTPRESPGIVTVIDGEEIWKSGASDLMEFLRLIPGFDFAIDAEGIIGIGVRGNWGHEGKVLLLWDGHEMNEELYSTLQFGGHYPLHDIKRIEIVRGPGSSMYGGFAEYAVINVVNNSTATGNRIHAMMEQGTMSRTFAGRRAAVSGGKKFGDVSLSFGAQLKSINRSQRNYTDVEGNSYDMTGESRINGGMYRMDAKWKDLSFSGMVDDYSVNQRDGYGRIYDETYRYDFHTRFFLTRYVWHLTDRLTITPGIRIKSQKPWRTDGHADDGSFIPYHTSISKRDALIHLNYDHSDRVNILGGVELTRQIAKQKIDTVNFYDGADIFIRRNLASFVQGTFRTKHVNVVVGSRFNYNRYLSASFVPRIAFTRKWEKFHGKLLYSKAFRQPSLENMNLAPEISPENTSVAEAEAGAKIGKCGYLTVNVYDVSTTDVIVYHHDATTNSESYVNEAGTGTRGVELHYQRKTRRMHANLYYSFYSTAGHAPLGIYAVPDKHVLLAFPAHQAGINSSLSLTNKLSINPSFIYHSVKYSAYPGENGERIVTFSPEIYFNVNLHFSDLIAKGFSIDAGCFNITDRKVNYLQPYRDGHAALPGPSRDFRLRLTYDFQFSK